MDAQTLFATTRARLKCHEGRYGEIASRYSGFGYSWLTKLAQGEMKDPKVSTLQALIEALDDFEGKPKPVRIDTPEATAAALPGARAEPPEPAGETPPEEPDPDEGRIGPAEEAA